MWSRFQQADFIEELLRMKMGLLVFMRNVLLALCLFLVLGFLYYSAWKLHLFQWEDSITSFEFWSKPAQIK
ncbi:hypothetical protein E2320_010145 [Naja naja]|nr:hypothetical protein E2320_010145 [Naja naja]